MLWSLCLLKLFRGVPGFREMILFGEWKETYAKEKSLHTFQDMDWIELEFDIRENSQKTSNEKRAPRGFCILNQTIVKFLCRWYQPVVTLCWLPWNVSSIVVLFEHEPSSLPEK